MNEDFVSSNLQLVLKLIDEVLHLIFLSSGERSSSVDEVERLFHDFLFARSGHAKLQKPDLTQNVTPTYCPAQSPQT